MTNQNSVLRIDPSQAKRAIAMLMKAQIVPVLVGAPGCGKTTAVEDLVQTFNDQGAKVNLVTKVLSQMDISNFSLPKEIESRIHDIVAEWIPLAEDEKEDDPISLIFFDEIDRCDQSVQNIILNILLGRRIADKKISSKVKFVGAMNGSSDMYTTQLSKAAVNRLCILYINSSTDSYIEWAEENGISDHRKAFQRFKAEELINNDEPFEDISYASNRSLDACDTIDQIITAGWTLRHEDVYKPIIAGLIGVPGMTEWVSFKALYDVAETPDVILADPQNAKINYDPSIKYAVLTNVVSYAMTSAELCEKAFQFASRFEPEYVVAFSNLLLDKAPEACTCPTYQKLHKTLGV